MKNLIKVFIGLALILSHVMCAHVAYNYRNMLCGISHMGYSAGADTAFLYIIPYLLGIGILLGCAYVVWRKSKNSK